MDKKNIIRIVAIVVVLAVLATVVVVSIKNDRDIYVDKDGVEHLLVTDAEGNTVLNNDGDMVVYATDLNGDVIENENGEFETAAIAFPDVVINDNTLETPYYKFSLSDAWELKEDGEFVLKANENVAISVIRMYEQGEKSLETCFNDEIERANVVIDLVKDQYPSAEVITGDSVLTMKNIQCKTMECKMVNEENGTVDYYSYSIYYLANGYLYQINIVFEDGSYDEAIKLNDLVNAGFAVKDTGNR